MKKQEQAKISDLSQRAQYILQKYNFNRSDSINTATVFVQDNQFYTIYPLCVAAMEGDIELADEIIQNGGELENDAARSPLHWATLYGRYLMVKHLLDKNADPGKVPVDECEAKTKFSVFTQAWGGYQKVIGKDVNYPDAIAEVRQAIGAKSTHKKKN